MGFQVEIELPPSQLAEIQIHPPRLSLCTLEMGSVPDDYCRRRNVVSLRYVTRILQKVVLTETRERETAQFANCVKMHHYRSFTTVPLLLLRRRRRPLMEYVTGVQIFRPKGEGRREGRKEGRKDGRKEGGGKEGKK